MDNEEKEAVAPKKGPSKRKTAVKRSVPVRREKPAKTFTFDQWAAYRSIRAQHRDGMKAFCANISKKRTLEQWDACFVGY